MGEGIFWVSVAGKILIGGRGQVGVSGGILWVDGVGWMLSMVGWGWVKVYFG